MKTVNSIVAIAALVLMICMPTTSADTPIDLGVKAGLNLASMSGSESNIGGQGPSMVVRGSGGLFLTLGLSKNFSLQTEVYYNQRSADWEYSTTSNDTTWNTKLNLGLEYVEIAVLAKFAVPTSGKISPFFLGGPAVAFNASSEAKEDVSIDTSGVLVYHPGPDYFSNIFNAKSTIFEVVLGGGVDIQLGTNRLSIEGRYTFSLIKAFEDPESLSGFTGDDALVINDSGKGRDMKHSIISFLIGFSFPI